MKRNQILSAIGFLLFIVPLNSQNVYLQYDRNCMDRLEYSVNKSKGNPVVAYQMKLEGPKWAVLEVGNENKRYIRTLDQKITRCQVFQLNRRLVQEINLGRRKVFIVKKNASGYNISAISKAVFYYQLGSEIELTSKDAELAFNFDSPDYDRDISLLGSQTKVYLEGVNFFNCTKGYILRKTKDKKSPAYKELTLIPEIGIIEKRSIAGSRYGKSQANVVSLTSVNGKDFNGYLDEKCAKMQSAFYDKNESNNSENATTAYDKQNNLRTNASPTDTKAKTADNPCGIEPSEGIHLVKQSETLYSIARRYNISLAQLRGWNELENSNTISPCQQLFVLPPATVTARQKREPQPAKPTPSQPKTTTHFTEKNNSDSPFWATSTKTYRVQRGETVAALAERYGFTEARFRWMNNLSSFERIRPGQELVINQCKCPQEKRALSTFPEPYDAAVTPKGYAKNSQAFSFGAGGNSLENRVDKSHWKVHVVKENETLYSISKSYNLTIDELRTMNGLAKGESIIKGQHLYVK